MAEIAVERKAKIPWWAWLLIALGIILLLWLILGPAATEERAATTETIRDISVLYNVDNPDALVNRPVQISEAQVLGVTGDRDFWIGERQGREVLVILNQVMTPQQPRIEGRYDVNAGQTIAILEGEVRRFPGWDEAQSSWNLNPELRSRFENQRIYIAADKLDIKEWRESEEPVQTQPK
jgi:hypothetical protein